MTGGEDDAMDQPPSRGKMTGPKLPWWRFLARAAIRETQGSWYSTWRDHARLSGENSEWAAKSRDRYYAHVQKHGHYELPRWRTRP